jgi:hypothetical protein
MLSNVFPLLTQYSIHPSAHLLVSTMLDTGTSVQCQWIAAKLSCEAVFLARDPFGSEVLCRALRRKEATEVLVQALSPNVILCSTDVYGYHVMEGLVDVLPHRTLGAVVRAMCQYSVKRLSQHKFACKVVQRLLRCCPSDVASPLLDALHACSYDLLAHPYGNYVLQTVLMHGRSQDTLKICRDVLLCDVVTLRQDRCAHVLVCKCVSILGHGRTPELQALWSALCASLASSDMWMFPPSARHARVKALQSFLQFMWRSSAGAQQEELRRCLALHDPRV